MDSIGNNEQLGREILLLGGGHTHALLLRQIGMSPLPGVKVTLVSDSPLAAYSGMVPGLVEGRFTTEEAHIDVARLARWAGAQFVLDKVRALKAETKSVELEKSGTVVADVISLNLGIQSPRVLGMDGDSRIVQVKPIAPFLEWLSELAGEISLSCRSVAVVGGGAAGIELALALKSRFGERLELALLENGARILAGYPLKAVTILEKKLQKAGVAVKCGFGAVQWEGGQLVNEESQRLSFDRVVLTSGAIVPKWLRESGLAMSERGFVEIDDTLRSTSHQEIFAVGDIADIKNSPRPKAGVFAVRQGKPLEINLRRYFSGQGLDSHRFQKRFLALIGTADSRAVFVKGGVVLEGGWVQVLKNYIDQKFMRQFSRLPERT